MVDGFGGEMVESGRPIRRLLEQPQEKMARAWLGMTDGHCQPWKDQCMVQESGRRGSSGDGLG